MWVDLILPDLRLIYVIGRVVLLRPDDPSLREEVLCKFEVFGIVGHRVQSEYCQLQLGMPGVTVQLIGSGAEMLPEAVDVLYRS